MRKGIFERAYLNWHYRKGILMKDISERAFPKGHFVEGHFEGRAFQKGERAKGMKGIVHKLEFPLFLSYLGYDHYSNCIFKIRINNSCSSSN